MNYEIIKLTNGEFVMGDVKGENDRCIDMDGGSVLELRNNSFGIPVIYMKKYCPFTDDFMVRIDKQFIMNRFTSIPETVIHYYEKTLDKQKSYYSSMEVVGETEAENADSEELVEAWMEKMFKGNKDVH